MWKKENAPLQPSLTFFHIRGRNKTEQNETEKHIQRLQPREHKVTKRLRLNHGIIEHFSSTYTLSLQ